MVSILFQENNNLGIKLSGDIDKLDYKQFVPIVENLVEKKEKINLLLDLSSFKWEKLDAWGNDFHFGVKYRNKIIKMAIVGDKEWEKWMTKFCAPFYSQGAKYFNSSDLDSARKWLEA